VPEEREVIDRQKYLARQSRYNRSEKGRARYARHCASPHGQITRKMYMTLYDQRRQLERSRQRGEEAYW
jgi:hypothetical protein